jgi:hypothetical protein
LENKAENSAPKGANAAKPLEIQADALTHGNVALDQNLVRIVDDAVKDSVGNTALANHLIPTLGSELSHENGRTLTIAGFDDFEQIGGLEVIERGDEPFVEDEEIGRAHV